MNFEDFVINLIPGKNVNKKDELVKLESLNVIVRIRRAYYYVGLI